MKTILLVLFSLVILNPTANAGGSAVIRDPKYPGTAVPFSYVAWDCPTQGSCPSGKSFTPARDTFYGADFYVNENGVCKVLGYKKALANSSKSNEGSDGVRRIQMTSSGAVAGAVAGRTLNQITCLNPTSRPKPSTLTKIDYPVHPKTGLHFSRPKLTIYSYDVANSEELASDPDRVCQILGHSRAVLQSGFLGNGSKVDEIGAATRVTTNGEISKVTAYILQSIICEE